jgi:hypothetical protein
MKKKALTKLPKEIKEVIKQVVQATPTMRRERNMLDEAAQENCYGARLFHPNSNGDMSNG